MAGVASMTLAVTPISATTPRFRATPIKKTGFIPNLDSFGSAGINNKGQIVYGFEDGEDIIRAFVWLPATDYGLAPEAVHVIATLSTVSGTGDDDDEPPTIARDINEAGIVVGQIGAATPGDGLGIAWNLDATDVPLLIYGTLGGNSPWSCLFAVNNDATAIVVGDSGAERPCACGEEEAKVVTRAFRATQSSATPVELFPQDEGHGYARDVNSDSTVRTVGTTNCFDPFTNVDCQGGPCTHDQVASYWDNTTVATLPALTGDYQRVGRGVNEAGDAVGYALIFGEGQNQCNAFATYWPDAGGVVDLSLYLPDGEEEEFCRAEATNNNALPQIVGRNITQTSARLWEKQSSGDPFLGTDLNASGVIACQARWGLFDGHDINDDTWIVVHATRSLGSEPVGSPYSAGSYIVLLTPFNDCPADVTRNGCVDTDDLLEIINNYNEECPIAEFCYRDTNGTGHVNLDDYLDVINGFCNENTCENECCDECEECQESLIGGSGGPSLEELIVAVLEGNIPQDEQVIIIESLIETIG